MVLLVLKAVEIALSEANTFTFHYGSISTEPPLNHLEIIEAIYIPLWFY